MADTLGWVASSFAVLFFTHWALQALKQWQSERHTELTSTDNEVASVGSPACLVPNLESSEPAQQSESFVNTKHGARQSDEQGLALWHRRGLL
jgi:hypothetical protein